MTPAPDIRQRILAAVPKRQAQPVVVKPETAKPKGSPFQAMMPLILGCCILVLSVATFWALQKKSSRTPAQPSPVGCVKTDPDRRESPPQVFATKADVEQAFAKLNERLDKADKRMDLWAHRVWLMGVAHNENVYLRQKQEKAYLGVSEQGYIVFDDNWKINRVPSMMQMDEKQKRALEDDLAK